MRTLTRTILASMLIMSAIQAQELGQWSFSDGVAGWTAVNNARVSDFARRPGGRSLVIRQDTDAEADSAWLGPVLANPGTPIRISVWAADNYDAQKDFSYAAAFELVACDKDGNLIGNGGDWTWVPWEDKRQIPQFRHNLTGHGLQWKHYEAVKRLTGGHFRLRLCWPKALSRGECHFTDISLATAEAGMAAQSGSAGTTTGRHVLEISTAANANLFFAEDPLRFDFLVYANDGEPVGTLGKSEIRYEITDYEHFAIASGTLPFAGAAPVALKQLDQQRSQNLRLSALIPDARARETGRQFFLHARLLDGDRLLAEDTTTYAVVSPRRLPEEAIASARFIAFGEGGGLTDRASAHQQQSLVAKMGLSLTQTWDYDGWRKAQPVKGGPITIPRGPDYPKLVYCPNLEQIRGRKPNHPWGDMTRNAPDWALIDDPLRPGCKGFDIDGYVDYIVAYVRTNRHRIAQVVPSGLERHIDARTLELQRKAYAALKREYPDLPVGMMTWGVNSSQEEADRILSERLYEVADFFNTHVYLSSIDWAAWDALRKQLKKLGIERQLISTEFACVGGNDQLQSSRDLISSMLDAHAHGMHRITYFLMYVGEAGSQPLRQPILRGSFPGDGFQWMQYVDRPRVADAAEGPWGRGAYGSDRRGASLMPMLKTTAYYNFVQAVEGADFKTVFQPTPGTIAYVYVRDGQTICYLIQREIGAPAVLALQADVAYTMQDIYGRRDRVTPAGGTSLVVATADPLLLHFEGEVRALHTAKTAAGALQATTAGLALPVIARGTTGTATLTMPFAGRIAATVDGTWPEVTVAAASGGSTLSIPIAATRPAGSYTFTTRVYRDDALITVLKQPLIVGEVLTAQIDGVAMTRTQDPAISVTIRSLAEQPMSGTVRLSNRFFGTGFAPAAMEQAYRVDARGSARVVFPLPRDQANLAVSYEMRATIVDASGFTVSCEDDVSFQACVKTAQPITVDGDLSDWDLGALLPIPFEKQHKPRSPQDFSGHFYTRWDDANLYFAAEITDSVPVVNGVGQPLWNDDNIMFCLYPWGWRMGEALNSGYYREHLGPTKGGPGGFMRVGHVPGGPSTAAGAQIAVVRTATGWIYEWSYPRAALQPLALVPGGAFRLSMTVWDQFKPSKTTDADWGEFSWLTFGGFNSSVNAQPNLWRQFRLVEQ
jgi:hypothetical protein